MSRDFIPGAEPLFIDGNEKGCLLLHGGGGGTTWDFKGFANRLHEETGMTVWLPSLTGYGTKPEDLIGVTLDDWLSDAHSGLDKLSKKCDCMSVVGHSMGGLLALLLSSERKEVGAVVTWAAPWSTRNRLLPLLPIISKIPGIRRAIPERYPAPVPDWLREKGWIGYEWIPSSLGFTIQDGLKRLKKALGNITCPALIIQGEEDEVMSADSPKRIHDGLSSKRKDLWIIKGASHPMLSDERFMNDLFERTIQFLRTEL
ncbi:MAG: alpha/beta fold hydrolase [Candidatus Thorarchaeota archaeon]|nr:alpha/beta fold hydrolase [Candidatus Thorarchaeota archaeon]